MCYGPEFTPKALDHWAYTNRVELNFSRPGRPGDNPHIEAFNSLGRQECLSQHWFIDLKEARSGTDPGARASISSLRLERVSFQGAPQVAGSLPVYERETRLVGRERDLNCGSFTGLARDLDATAVLLHQSSHGGQTHPSSLR